MRLPKFYRDRGHTNDMVVQLSITASVVVALLVILRLHPSLGYVVAISCAAIPVGFVAGFTLLFVLATHFRAEDRK